MNYNNFWLLFVNIKAKRGKNFSDLVSSDRKIKGKPIGAWANIIIKSDSIAEALKILPLGLDEKHFDVEFVDRIENVQTLLDNDELSAEFEKDVDWLQKSDYIFKICGDIFSYTKL